MTDPGEGNPSAVNEVPFATALSTIHGLFMGRDGQASQGTRAGRLWSCFGHAAVRDFPLGLPVEFMDRLEEAP